MSLEDFCDVRSQAKDLSTDLAKFALDNMEDFITRDCFDGGSGRNTHCCLPEVILTDATRLGAETLKDASSAILADVSLNRILDALKPTAKKLTLENMDVIGKVVSHFPDGRIDPDDIVMKLQMVTGRSLDGELADMIKNIDHIDKKGDHIDVKFHKPMKIEQNQEVPGTGGLLKVKDVELKDLSFDVRRQGDNVSLKNIKGVNVNVELPGPDVSVPVTNIDLVRGRDGKLEYQATAKNTHPLAILPGVPGEFKTTLKVAKNGDLVVAKV